MTVVYLRQRAQGPAHAAVARSARVVVTGFATGHCVDSTSRAALAHGLDLGSVADVHTTVERSPDHALTAGQIIAYADRSISVIPSARLSLVPAS